MRASTARDTDMYGFVGTCQLARGEGHFCEAHGNNFKQMLASNYLIGFRNPWRTVTGKLIPKKMEIGKGLTEIVVPSIASRATNFLK
eukprot:1768834-Amphidinium_carterae.1